MSSKQFTRQIFDWLHAIKADHANVPPVTGLAVAFQMTVYFNEDGRPCFASCKTIGDAIGKSEATVMAVVRKLEAVGYLRVEWGKPGRGHSNRYWPVLKPQPVKVSQPPKTSEKNLRKPVPKPQPAKENHCKNHEGISYRDPLSWERESQPSAAAPPPPGAAHLAAAPEGKDDAGKDQVPCQAEPRPQPPSQPKEYDARWFAQLRAAWIRPWADNDDRQALELYAIACQEVGPQAILEAAQAWVAAADAPRFLQPLSKWLAGRGWEKPPPQKKRTTRHGMNGHYRRPSLGERMLALSEELEA